MICYLLGCDSKALKALMDDFEENGKLDIPKVRIGGLFWKILLWIIYKSESERKTIWLPSQAIVSDKAQRWLSVANVLFHEKPYSGDTYKI